MTSETELAKEAKILDLFDGWPRATPTADVLRAYLLAVNGLSVEAVSRSVSQFTRGLVERNNAFEPSSAEFAENVREWQHALDQRSDEPELHNGLLNMDFGAGSIDMRGLTMAEQDQIIAAKGRAPDGRSLAYLPLAEIRAALVQTDLAQVEGGRSFAAPRLGRMGS